MTRHRWRCALCAGFGFADTEKQAFSELERHYQAKHMTKERA